MKLISAKELFEKSHRFDLIYKILLLEHQNCNKKIKGYYEQLYLDSINVFNGFYEESPLKETPEDFLDSFYENYKRIKENGYTSTSPIPVNKQMQLYDGAHRLSIAYVLDLQIPIEYKQHTDNFDYKFFFRRGIRKELADIGALEYVIHNKKAHIVQIFPIIPTRYDKYIEKVLNRNGFIYYKKAIFINYNGIIRIKQINYGKEKWAGNEKNGYCGLSKHASECLGYGKLRIYVFVCDSVEDAVNAKTEIRSHFNLGNFPIHINDDHEEAEKLANIYFNSNALNWINSSPFTYNFYALEITKNITDYCKRFHKKSDNICVSSSAVLGIYGLRKAADLDCISANGESVEEYDLVSSHESEKAFYPADFESLVNCHRNYFRVGGIKFLSLYNVLLVKAKRHEFPKDIRDIILILLKGNSNKWKFTLMTIFYYIPETMLRNLFRALKMRLKKVVQSCVERRDT